MSPLVSEKKKQSLVDVCKNQNIDVTEYSEAKKGIFKLTLWNIEIAQKRQILPFFEATKPYFFGFD